MLENVNLLNIINALAVLFLSAFIGWTKYREKKLSKESNLMDNPERCKNHADRLQKIEESIGTMKTNIAVIKYKLGIGDE